MAWQHNIRSFSNQRAQHTFLLYETMAKRGWAEGTHAFIAMLEKGLDCHFERILGSCSSWEIPLCLTCAGKIQDPTPLFRALCLWIPFGNAFPTHVLLTSSSFPK